MAVKCPNCKSEEVWHHDAEDPALFVCSNCGQEFYDGD